LKFVTGEQAEFFSKSGKAVGKGGYAWLQNTALYHQNLKVVRALAQGNKVVLNVSATQSYSYDKFELRREDSARVLMMNEGAQWKIIKQSWKPGKMTRVSLKKTGGSL